MKVLIRLNGESREATIIYLSLKDFGFIAEWEMSIDKDPNPIRRDAVDFARLAWKRFRTHSPYEIYARQLGDIADHVRNNPRCEVGNLIGLTCEGFPASKLLGVAHFRRTWCNNLVLDYLAVHPQVARKSEDYPFTVRGVGTSILFFLSSVAKKYECACMWGEATQNSCEFYQKAFSLDSVQDLLYSIFPRLTF